MQIDDHLDIATPRERPSRVRASSWVRKVRLRNLSALAVVSAAQHDGQWRVAAI